MIKVTEVVIRKENPLDVKDIYAHNKDINFEYEFKNFKEYNIFKTHSTKFAKMVYGKDAEPDFMWIEINNK